MKIVMLGPVYPYKGGISHYTGMMSRNLSKEHEIINLSFRLQYPKFLYKREQKDFQNDTFKVDNTHFLLNTANPISWVKTAAFINRQKPDLLILQWWHPYFAPSYWSVLKQLDKNIKVLMLCHNVLPHESFPAKHFLAKRIFKNSDFFIVHSNKDANDLKALVDKPHYKHAYLPTFNAFKFQNMTSEEARNSLKLNNDEPILLFFGYIREYKGLKHLLHAMPKIQEAIPNIKLLVVGEFFEGNKDEYITIIDNNSAKDRIILIDGYVPDNAIEKYFTACDLVVLPYESATQSGIVQISYSFNKPVIATDVGGLPEVVINEKTGFIVQKKNSDELARAVIRYFKDDCAPRFTANVQSEAYKYEWDRMNEAVNNLCF